MVSALVFAPPPPLVGNKALFTYGGVEILLVNSCYRKRVQVTLKTDTLYLPGDAREKIVLVETNVLPTAERHVAVTSEQEIYPDPYGHWWIIRQATSSMTRKVIKLSLPSSA